MPSSGLDVNYHLLRVRVKKHVFYRLQNLAMEDRHATGEYTTVSDLVRSAIIDWLHIHDATRRLESFGGVFKPSGMALPLNSSSHCSTVRIWRTRMRTKRMRMRMSTSTSISTASPTTKTSTEKSD